MPWELSIDTIDVGQGESSLVIAENVALGLSRSMLIDGGLGSYAQTVHDFIIARGLANGPDHILVTHYDKDHTGGITALLNADNLYRVSDMIAAGAALWSTMLGAPNTRPNRAAAAAAAAYAIAAGCYNIPGGANHSARVGIAVTAAHQDYKLLTVDNAINKGLFEVNRILGGPYNPWLVSGSALLGKVARAAGVAAATAIAANVVVVDATRTAVFNILKTGIGAEESRFQTGGIYRNTHIIDIGHTNHISTAYTNAVAGLYTLTGGGKVQAIGTNRVRLGPPALGDEVLWNSGAGNIPAPANSPAAFVVARLKSSWNGIGRPARGFDSDQHDNDDSIGLIVRFNRFYYYTGGDLPSEGDELIANAVMNRRLPNPQNPAAPFATPERIACFKCGHHGAESSTSQTFLDTALPRAALISCGRLKPGPGDNHPTQLLVNRLHGDAQVRRFYLTNCKYATNYIPASQGGDQLGVAGNKSRVAGEEDAAAVDTATDVASNRERGNIRVYLNEAESVSPHTAGPLPGGAVLRQFHVRYFEEDANVNNFRIEDTVF